ncbi:sugar ABC transporter substrate-binding protein [Phaeobacter sp. LSS9]|uniref:sugar ABC transporter substrate-binding protein n=1 Tax=unclassified Phaeobacter TaxID=2621772 RepID=UPI000E4C1536|nr:sugar ABC transporter substrate-binding protein [Phaeobacter sp. LSS9]AXT36256.1 sugar ABC transporter substrate-binding protein [Phaeobacter sp. LSS9]
MKLNRRTFLASATAAGAVASGLVRPAFAQGSIKITSVVTRLANDYFTDWNVGATQAAEALGVDYNILEYEGSAAKHIEIIESQLENGVKGFFGDSNDTANVRNITNLTGANDATNIAVWDTLPWMHPIDQGMGYGSYFTADDVVNAYNLAKVLFEAMGGKGNLVHVTGFPGATPDIARTRGLDKALAEFPDIKLVVRQPGNWNPIDGRQVMEDAIVAHGQIDGVYAQNDSIGLGVVQALEEAGIEIPVVGHDGNADNLDMIAEGRYLATISYMPQYQAGYALVRAFDVIQGFEPSPVERMMYTGGTLVTKDNVAALKTFLAGDNGKLPFDWRKMSRTLHPDDWDPQNVVWPADVADMWAPFDKPAGYELPAAYRDAVAAGDLDKVKAQYADHYQMKLPF